MTIILDPRTVAAGIYFLDEEQMVRFRKAIDGLDEDRDPLGYVTAISVFLLREIGPLKLSQQLAEYPKALEDGLAAHRAMCEAEEKDPN